METTEDYGCERDSALPRVSRMGHLAWGLAGFGVGFFVVLIGIATATAIESFALDAGLTPTTLPGGHSFPLAENLRLGLLVGSICGPMIFAGGLAAGRARWWFGPVGGWLIGIGAGAVLFLTSAPAVGFQAAFVQPVIWLFGGSVGSLLSAVRRRWKC